MPEIQTINKIAMKNIIERGLAARPNKTHFL